MNFSSQRKQYGFNLIELGQIIFLVAFIGDLYLLINGSLFGIPLAYIIVNFIAGILVLDKTKRDAQVFKPRIGRIVFVILVVLLAPVVCWLNSIIAVLVSALISYLAGTNTRRLWSHKAGAAAGSGNGNSGAGS